MLTIKTGAAFRRDYKRMKKRRYNLNALEDVIKLLAAGIPLPAKYRDHLLVGEYAGCHECHIEPDWLLVYEIKGQELLLYLLRTGTHSDLFP